MSRLHVSVSVPDLEAARTFYSAMFGAEPTVLKPDYAKWMLEDPKVNFVIQTGEGAPGVSHLGIQADDHAELEKLYGRFHDATDKVFEEGETQCCYAQSEKSWVADPAGIAWEAFVTTAQQDEFGKGVDLRSITGETDDAQPGCCVVCG